MLIMTQIIGGALSIFSVFCSQNIRIKSSHDVSKGKDSVNEAVVNEILPPVSIKTTYL